MARVGVDVAAGDGGVEQVNSEVLGAGAGFDEVSWAVPPSGARRNLRVAAATAHAAQLGPAAAEAACDAAVREADVAPQAASVRGPTIPLEEREYGSARQDNDGHDAATARQLFWQHDV